MTTDESALSRLYSSRPAWIEAAITDRQPADSTGNDRMELREVTSILAKLSGGEEYGHEGPTFCQ